MTSQVLLVPYDPDWPRRIDEDLSHRPRHGRAEVRAAAVTDARVVDEPQVGLVDERRRLQGHVPVLALQLPVRHPVQLVVDERHELVQRRQVSRVGQLQQGRRARAEGLVDAAVQVGTLCLEPVR